MCRCARMLRSKQMAPISWMVPMAAFAAKVQFLETKIEQIPVGGLVQGVDSQCQTYQSQHIHVKDAGSQATDVMCLYKHRIDPDAVAPPNPCDCCIKIQACNLHFPSDVDWITEWGRYSDISKALETAAAYLNDIMAVDYRDKYDTLDKAVRHKRHAVAANALEWIIRNHCTLSPSVHSTHWLQQAKMIVNVIQCSMLGAGNVAQHQ